jgi:hypothetical protein
MQATGLSFVIPTCRLRDVGEAIRLYDEHFRRNGHAVPIIVFDDSSPAAPTQSATRPPTVSHSHFTCSRLQLPPGSLCYINNPCFITSNS